MARDKSLELALGEDHPNNTLHSSHAPALPNWSQHSMALSFCKLKLKMETFLATDHTAPLVWRNQGKVPRVRLGLAHTNVGHLVCLWDMQGQFL